MRNLQFQSTQRKDGICTGAAPGRIIDDSHLMKELNLFFADAATRVEAVLERLIDSAYVEPPVLLEAVRWSLFGGGKRLRPILMLAVGEAFGVREEKLLRTAAAVEMIHTYSLVHDDLPAMDDDDLRRGRETSHKKFGEATAILAGDVLQVLAFRAIAEDDALPEKIRVPLVSGLALAAIRMVAGQQMDLESEGKRASGVMVESIHRNKTGALIGFSVSAAAIIGEAGEKERSAIQSYAERLGLLFQIRDDILDVTQSTSALGKTAAKDVSSKKATYPSVYGLNGARDLLNETYQHAIECLRELDRPTERLYEIAGYVLRRDS